MLFHSHRTGRNFKDWQCQVSENGEQWEPVSTSGGDAGVWNDATSSKILQCLPQLEMDLPPHLRSRRHAQDVSHFMFCRCPASEERVNKMWYLYIMKYVVVHTNEVELCISMDRSQKPNAEQEKLVSKWYIQYCTIYLKFRPVKQYHAYRFKLI